jgi:Fur family transcriptional regulator, ferric uptake regulator
MSGKNNPRPSAAAAAVAAQEPDHHHHDHHDHHHAHLHVDSPSSSSKAIRTKTIANESLSKQRPQDIIRATGARVTQPRLQVITLLQQAQHALSHMDVWEAVCERSIANEADRVTIYRVLDWLVTEGIAHRLAGQDRVWRFVLNDHALKVDGVSDHEHAHFVCMDCGKTQCLVGVPAPSRPALPTGYEFESVEINVRGHCADCVSVQRGSLRKGASRKSASRSL